MTSDPTLVMTSSGSTAPPPPAPPAPAPPPGSGGPHGPAPGDGARERRSRLRRFGDDLLYVLVGFPVALASFIALVTLLSLGVSLVILVVGVPILVLSLYVARLFAGIERSRLRLRGERIGPVVYAESAPGATWSRRVLDRLTDRQAWLDVLHGLVAFPLATATWSLLVSWIASAALGITAFAWAPYATFGDANDPVTLFFIEVPTDSWVGPAAAITAIGVFFAATLWPVARGLAAAQAGLARLLLANDTVARLQARVEDLRRRQHAAAATDVTDRQRLERDIHDGPQQRLVRLGMDLAAAERRLGEDPDGARELLAEARQQTNAALAELRLLSRGIAPPLLTDRGLAAALADLGTRSVVPVDVTIRLREGDRLPTPVENALYFTAAETLANVAKHAGATRASVELEAVATPDAPGRRLARLSVADDGRGGAVVGAGHGLVGLRTRLELVDGTLRVDSPPGAGTLVVAEVPCGS